MDKFEQRRLDLLHLVTQMGKGGRSRVAMAIGKPADYISRMLYPKDKPGRKGIGEDSVDLLDKAFPGWRSGAHAGELPASIFDPKPTWPFRSVTPQQWAKLSLSTRGLIETQVLAVVLSEQANKFAA